MPLSYSFNAVLGCFLILIIIIIDYIRKFNTDSFLRVLYLITAAVTIAAMICDFALIPLENARGTGVHTALYVINALYYFFQVGALSMTAVFIDYVSFKDKRRARVVIGVASALTLFHALLLAFNADSGFYFQISADNAFAYGRFYFIRLLITYIPFIIVIVDVLLSRKNIPAYQANFIILFLALVSLGAILGFFFDNTLLFWTCFTACFLSAYLFIVRSDEKIDPLTGIGNRFLFNEFIDRLNKRGAGQSWSIAIIDIDQFKYINSEYGRDEGDRALRDVAATMKDCIRGSDMLVRYGSDEFLLAIRSEYDIHRLMERILSAVESQNRVRSFPLVLNYSCGSFISGSEENINDCVSEIERSLYQQKAPRRRADDEDIY